MSNGRLDYRNTVVGPVQLDQAARALQDHAAAEGGARPRDLGDFGVNLPTSTRAARASSTRSTSCTPGGRVYEGELWPHNSVRSLSYPGGIRTHFYQVSSMGRSPVDLSIGTFATRPGHLLCRFPDLYDYGKRDGDFEKSAGIGVYCLMGSGNHLGQGRAPAAISGYLRDLVGWPDEVVPLDPGEHELRQGDYAPRPPLQPDRAPQRVLRRREPLARSGTDASLPSSGLAVFHCDTLGLERVGGRDPRAPLPARPGPGRRPPRPRDQPQHRRRGRPVRRGVGRRRRLARHDPLVAALGRDRLGADDLGRRGPRAGRAPPRRRSAPSPGATAAGEVRPTC